MKRRELPTATKSGRGHGNPSGETVGGGPQASLLADIFALGLSHHKARGDWPQFALPFTYIASPGVSLSLHLHADAEASWPLPALPKLPHGRVRGLDIPAKPVGVEQGTFQPVFS